MYLLENEVNLCNYDIDLTAQTNINVFLRNSQNLLSKTPKSLLELSVEELAAKSAKKWREQLQHPLTPSCTVRGACPETLKDLAVAEESTGER